MERIHLDVGVVLAAVLCAGCGSHGGGRMVAAPSAPVAVTDILPVPAPSAVVQPAQPYRILLPTTGRSGDPLILYCLGSGETAEVIETDLGKRAMIEGLLARGYVVAASDAHGRAWGNDASLADYRELVTYVRARYSTGPTIILAQSMGGIPGLLLIARGTIPNITGFVGMEPCVDLAAMWAGPLGPAVAAAYGAGGGDFPAAAADHNPLAYPASVYQVPMRLYASPEDTLVPKARHADVLAALTGATVVECRGGHGDPSHFQAEDVISFVRSIVEP